MTPVDFRCMKKFAHDYFFIYVDVQRYSLLLMKRQMLRFKTSAIIVNVSAVEI